MDIFYSKRQKTLRELVWPFQTSKKKQALKANSSIVHRFTLFITCCTLETKCIRSFLLFKLQLSNISEIIFLKFEDKNYLLFKFIHFISQSQNKMISLLQEEKFLKITFLTAKDYHKIKKYSIKITILQLINYIIVSYHQYQTFGNTTQMSTLNIKYAGISHFYIQ